MTNVLVAWYYSHRQAQAAVLEGIQRLHELNVPTKRPDDYFAEMVKSDAHMKKVYIVIYVISNCSFFYVVLYNCVFC